MKDDHIQKPVEPEDDGEIVLWDDVLVEESDEEAGDTHGERDEDSSEDNEEAIEEGNWWRKEEVQRNMVERHKYERITSQPHERTLRRWRNQEEEHRAHVARMGNIETMFRRWQKAGRRESMQTNYRSLRP